MGDSAWETMADKCLVLLPTGQYLRTKPDEELVPKLASRWAAAGLLRSDEATPFVTAAVQAAKKSLASADSHAACVLPAA